MQFLLDGMLGKLARWLRMLGYEVVYLKNSSDQELLSLAERDSFTLLTSDEELYRTAAMRNLEASLVQGRTEAERLAELAGRYDLRLEIDTTNSKCPMCGFPIKEIPKGNVEKLVPPTTFKLYQSFWVCTNSNCAKVYWHGSHWKKIEQTLESARKVLDATRDGATTTNRAEPRRG
jgi:uncharacterized protein with PIN domain